LLAQTASTDEVSISVAAGRDNKKRPRLAQLNNLHRLSPRETTKVSQ
jgi:hypothetical protein